MTDSDPKMAAVNVPPEVRVISAWQTFALSVMASFTELAVIVATTHEHAHGRLSTELWVGAVLVPALGPLIGRARGKLPGPTVLALGSAASAAAQAAQRMGKLALPLALLLPLLGCGQQPTLQDARGALVRLGNELNRVRAVLVAACQEPPMPGRETCAEAQDAFDSVQRQYDTLRVMVP